MLYERDLYNKRSFVFAFTESDKDFMGAEMSDKTEMIAAKKKVDFNISPATQLNASLAAPSVKVQFTQRPKNSLKHFNIDSNR